ncbi:unnamed protein product, partial [Mesorhabditis belari]|uniref:Thioredoxin domain-containing protein n=1 Tax=Mesorhabditis belari TaxID=2138241 RepID=A0AAF3F611_9BILA
MIFKALLLFVIFLGTISCRRTQWPVQRFFSLDEMKDGETYLIFYYWNECQRSNWVLPEIQKAAQKLLDDYGIKTASLDWEDIGIGFINIDQRLEKLPGVYVRSRDGIRMRYSGNPVDATAEDFVNFVLTYRFHAKKTDFGLHDHWGTAFRA